MGKENRGFLQALARDIVGGVSTAFNVLTSSIKLASTEFNFIASKVQNVRARWSDLIAAFKTNQVEEMEKALRTLAIEGKSGSEHFKTLKENIRAL